MKLSEEIAEKVAKLEKDNADLRTGWAHDLGEMIEFHEAAGHADVVERARECLKNLQN